MPCHRVIVRFDKRVQFFNVSALPLDREHWRKKNNSNSYAVYLLSLHCVWDFNPNAYTYNDRMRLCSVLVTFYPHYEHSNSFEYEVEQRDGGRKFSAHNIFIVSNGKNREKKLLTTMLLLLLLFFALYLKCGVFRTGFNVAYMYSTHACFGKLLGKVSKLFSPLEKYRV